MHRFSLIVNDLQASETIAHKTSVLTFINAVINSTPDITERIRIRNEFVGKLSLHLNFIRLVRLFIVCKRLDKFGYLIQCQSCVVHKMYMYVS